MQPGVVKTKKTQNSILICISETVSSFSSRVYFRILISTPRSSRNKSNHYHVVCLNPYTSLLLLLLLLCYWKDYWWWLAALGIVSVSEASIYIHLLSSGFCHSGLGLNMRRVAGLLLAKITMKVMMTYCAKMLLSITSWFGLTFSVMIVESWPRKQGHLLEQNDQYGMQTYSIGGYRRFMCLWLLPCVTQQQSQMVTRRESECIGDG